MRICFRTSHGDAELVAGAVAPDNTPEIRTRVRGGEVVTVIERGDVGSLQATADDYLRNLDVAVGVLDAVEGLG